MSRRITKKLYTQLVIVSSLLKRAKQTRAKQDKDHKFMKDPKLTANVPKSITQMDDQTELLHN